MSFISIVTLILHVSENLNNFESFHSSEAPSELFISYEVVGLFILAFALLLGFSLKLLKTKLSF